MGRQGASEVIFIALNHNITFVGKMWLVLMVFLRILVLLFAGYPLYQDDQERFVCNTIQPGCANVCYDMFAPLSLFRFWLVQLTTLCLPYAAFAVYVVHKVTSALAADPGGAGPLCALHRGSFRKASLSEAAFRAEGGGVPRFAGAYLLHLLFRSLLEAGFGAAQYYLFGVRVPRRVLCQQAPCTTTVDCYASRPTEKSLVLGFMLAAAALSLLLDALDLVCAVRRLVRQETRRKTLVEKMYEEERYYLSPGGGAVDARVPAPRDLPAPGGFRKRGASDCGADAGVLVRLGEAERPCGPRGGALAPGSTSGDGYPSPPEEGGEGEGSEAALCPAEPLGTPRSIRVSKRGRLKPPPPPRRDKAPGAGPADVSAAAAVCTRRVGQYTLVEMTSGADLAPDSADAQEKRSEWV